MSTSLGPPRPEAPDIEELRDQLAEARQRTRASLEDIEVELRTELLSWLDWRQAYQTHPGRFLAAAFAFGVLIGSRR